MQLHVLFVLSFLLVSSALADELVLSGTPLTKVESTSNSTQRTALSPEDAEEYSVTIVKRGARYFWASRENRELHHHVSGVYHHFKDLTGGGYVKVETLSSGEVFAYYEHLNLGLVTITYWGTSPRYAP